MALPDPVLTTAKAILNIPSPIQRRPDYDDIFMSAVQSEFPTLAAHQNLPPETPLIVPHLVLQSTASRASVSAIGSEFETRFYGDYQADRELCFSYVRRKLNALLTGWEALGARPSFLGVIMVAHVSFPTDGETPPARFLAERHLRTGVSDDLQDVTVRRAFRHAESHFISVSLANYEVRGIERPVFGGPQLIQVRPWEGRLDDLGIELTVDVNNRLRALITRSDPEVGEDEVETILALNRRVIERSKGSVIETGELDIDALTMENT